MINMASVLEDLRIPARIAMALSKISSLISAIQETNKQISFQLTEMILLIN